MATLTAANASLALAIIGLYDSPQNIQGFAVDDMFTHEAVELAETAMGVDGILSGGFVFNPVKQTITIMPTSDSLTIFETWMATQLGNMEVYPGNATLMYPAIKRKYTFTNGFLTLGPPAPSAKKILQPLAYNITWQRVIGEPM